MGCYPTRTSYILLALANLTLCVVATYHGDTSSGNIISQHGKYLPMHNKSDASSNSGVNDDGQSDEKCEQVKKVNASDTCEFVNRTENCQIDQGFINYVNFVYCVLPHDLIPLSTVTLLLWWLLLFLALATCADDFFCPSLVVVARTLHLSENIAGVTLVAFGNGAPDVFSAISAVRGAKDGDIGLALGALLGAGTFVTTIVVGAICMVGPFQAAGRPFLRDVIFYIGTVFFTFYILFDGKVTQIESIMFLVLYVVYVLVVVIGRVIYQRIRNRTPRLEPLNEDVSVPDNHNNDDDDSDDIPVFRSHVMHSVLSDEQRYRVSRASELHHSTDVLPDGTYLLPPAEPSQLQQFKTWVLDVFVMLNPLSEWREKGPKGKAFLILQVPVLLLLRVTVPLVDEDRDDRGWCYLLNSLQCIITPTVALFLIHPQGALMMVGGVMPVYGIVLLIGTVLAFMVLITSKNRVPPIYHPVFAYAGFLASIIWIQAIANEIVNIMQALGIVFRITQAVLGLTFLAWGNSIGDLIADTIMAKQGRARMAISACFGGPLFNLLLGVGIPFTMRTTKEGPILVPKTVIQLVLVAGLLVSLLSSIIYVTFTKFNFNRYYGFYLFGLYVAFIVVAILVEVNVIPSLYSIS